MLYGNNQPLPLTTSAGIGRPQTLPPLQQQMQQQHQQTADPGNAWALPHSQSQQSQQSQAVSLLYNITHQQLPIPFSTPNQLQSIVPPFPITTSHHQQQQLQQIHLHHAWMDAPGPSSGFSIPTLPTTSNGLTTHSGNGSLPFSQFSSSSAGFNGQIVTGLTAANGMMPTTSIPTSNGNAGATAPTPQSIQPAVICAVKQTKELEEYYARQNAQNIAAAASQMFGQASTSQKIPKLEGLPAGVIPAGGIRKPKQSRPRSDVVQPGASTSGGTTSAAAGGATVKAELSPTGPPPTNNGPVRRPDANATGGEIVSYLMTFNIQAAEADFSSKALESLHKKIKDRPHDMEAFMRAVETKGEVLGPCITVTRTLDGRLQVAGRKGFPHVIYTKIFRFQELHKNELKSIPQCIYGFDNKSEEEKARERHQNGQRAQNGYLATAAMIMPNEEHKPDAQVCVNPYHYERVTAPSGGGSLIDPLTGLLRANALQSMDEMMDFATSSMKMTTPETSSGQPSSSRSSWPVVTVADAKKEEDEEELIVVDSSDNDAADPPPQLQHYQADYMEQMRRLQQGSSSSAATMIGTAYPAMQLMQQPLTSPAQSTASLQQEALRMQAALQQMLSPSSMDTTSTSNLQSYVADPLPAASLLPLSQQLSVDTVSTPAIPPSPAASSDLSQLCGFSSYSALHAAAAAAATPAAPAAAAPAAKPEKMEEDPVDFADAEEEMLMQYEAAAEKLRLKKAAAAARKAAKQQQLLHLALQVQQQPSSSTTDAILAQMAQMFTSRNDDTSSDEHAPSQPASVTPAAELDEQQRAFISSMMAEYDANQPCTSSSSDPSKREEREKEMMKLIEVTSGKPVKTSGRVDQSTGRPNPVTNPDSGPNFLQSRTSMMEELRLSNPPAQGGFGFTSFDTKPVIDKAGPSQEKSPSQLENFMQIAATLSQADAQKLNELIEHIKGYSVAEEAAMAVESSDDAPHHDSESDRTHDEASEATKESLSIAARENFAFDQLMLDNSKDKEKLEEMKKSKEDDDADRIPTDDPDWPEEMMERQKKAQELEEHERKFKERENRLANMMMARDNDFANIEEATIWNAQYNDDSGRPSFFRKNNIIGLPPNTKVVAGETGNGTYGSKGPHLRQRQRLGKLEWSLQQVVRMLAKCAEDVENVDTTQWMLCCQHYAGMIKKTAGANSMDPEQVRLCKAALERVKEAGGGVVTEQQLHAWDLSRLFANHIKTLPQRREEQAERRREGLAFNREWTFDINQELDRFVAEAKGTDAEGIFSPKQVEKALEARQRLIRGEKLVPDELMEVEELRTRGKDDSRKRGRAEAGLDDEMEAIDLNAMGMSVEEQGQDEDDFDPLLPVLENVFTAEDLNALLDSPSGYLRTFRDHVFGEDLSAVQQQEEMDVSLRGTVPPAEGNSSFQPFDGRERENDEPDENGEERPPLKKNCACPEEEKKEHCFWGKHHHYMHGVSREIVDAAFLLYRYRIQRKKSTGPRDNFASQFDCPKVCLKRTMEIEPHSAKLKPSNYAWCGVQYNERNNLVGPLRQVKEVNFFIDGGFESDNGSRLCVSTISNPLTRFDRQVYDVRSKIGCGIRISVKEDGSMWVRVLSRKPIFVSSTFLDREAGLVNGDAVHKIYPGSAIKVFDLVRARRAILQLYDYQSEANKLHNGEKLINNMPYPLNTFNRRELRTISRIGGDDLQQHAIVKISFCKGWGPEFEYKSITETPCWVKIINNRASEFIDHIMNMRAVSYAFSDLDSSDYE